MTKLPTIDFKGKPYVTVAERVKEFNRLYVEGSIRTELISQPNDDRVIFKAIAYPDTKNLDRCFVGHSQAIVGEGYINKTSALENAETSAVGRALGLMGIGVIDSIASADELNKTTNYVPHTKQPYGKNENNFIKDMEQY